MKIKLYSFLGGHHGEIGRHAALISCASVSWFESKWQYLK